jgi:hypothetical protein
LSDVTVRLRALLEDSADFEGVVPVLESMLDPPDLHHVDACFTALHAAGLMAEGNDYGELTAVGKLVGLLPVSVALGRLIAQGTVLGLGVEATVLAAALSMPKTLFRVASPTTHANPDEFNFITQQTFLGALALDAGVYSEPIMCLHMFIAWQTLGTPERQDRWAQRHGVVRSRMRQFASFALYLLARVAEVLGEGSDDASVADPVAVTQRQVAALVASVAPPPLKTTAAPSPSSSSASPTPTAVAATAAGAAGEIVVKKAGKRPQLPTAWVSGAAWVPPPPLGARRLNTLRLLVAWACEGAAIDAAALSCTEHHTHPLVDPLGSCCFHVRAQAKCCVKSAKPSSRRPSAAPHPSTCTRN